MRPSCARDLLLSILFALSVVAARPARAHAQWPPESFKNLEVLPKDITFQEIFRTMSGFTRALGVRCSYCHVGDPNASLAEYDFVSDEKATKQKARQMLRMVDQINNVNLAGLPARSTPALSVQCATCHRGVPEPRMIQDVVLQAYETGGLDAALAKYHDLRDEYYGRSAYDFGDVPLVDVAAGIARRALPDAIRFLELNVEMNPESTFARTQLLTLVLNEAFSRGADVGKQAYDGFRGRFGATGIPESLLNSVGHSLLRRNAADAAVTVFQLNADAYPQSGGAYDALGEGLAAKGDVPGAILAYERAHELDPDNQNAVQKLRELRGR